MNLCVFQGTFNPFHNAHIRIADYTMDKYKFNKLIFIPAYKPPHKDYNDKMSYHRLNMVKLAIESENNPKFEVSDIEYQRQVKSYTYVTICELYKIYNLKRKINFIIGTDAFDNIESWYKADELKKLLRFIVFKRENDCHFEKYDRLKSKGYDFICENLPFEDISSTKLRELIHNGMNCENYLNIKVKEYIENNELYKDEY